MSLPKVERPHDRERDAWLARLDLRLREIAGRRVAAGAVDDVVQEAMRVIVEKGPAQVESARDRPALPWCFQVLRNCIGNHYQRQRLRRHGDIAPLQLAAETPTPLEALEQAQLREGLEAAIDDLDRSPRGGDCARYLRLTLSGLAPAALARREGLGAAVLYRRLYRCRARLRKFLMQRGIRS